MNNPLVTPSKLKNAAVPFNLIKPEHFAPALDAAIKKGEEILAGVRRAPASFDDTFRALETCTEELEFVFLIFNNLLGADSNDELQKLSMELGPRVASFANDILLDPGVFAKVEEVYKSRAKMALDAEQIRLVEKIYRDFQRSGAGLDDKKKARLREIDERMSQLSPKFRENVLKSTNNFELWIDAQKDLAGLPPTAVAAAAEAATAKGRAGKWLFTLHQPSYLPFIRYADNRALREKISTAFNTRAMDGEFDNQPVIK
jgi:peptidyl-dipeptidase Dcp